MDKKEKRQEKGYGGDTRGAFNQFIINDNNINSNSTCWL